MSFSGKIAAITGAGSGIGRALAIKLAEQGCSVAISDVDEEGLNETAKLVANHNVGCHKTILDVKNREDVEKWADTVVKDMGGADYIFNNAGVALMDCVETMKYEDFRWIMDINFWGMVYGSKAFLTHFSKQKSGHIINVSSLFGLIAFPSQSAYNASKFAIRGFTEALAIEQKDTDVFVSSVHPGGIKTNIAKNARFINSGMPGMKKSDSEKAFDALAKTTPTQAADVILKGVLKKKKRILIGSDARLLDRLQRLMPVKYTKLISLLTK